ncbi:hypothetical protein FKM82_021553, partial [Ascaphus truei]
MQHNSKSSSLLPILLLLAACAAISSGAALIQELRCLCIKTVSKPLHKKNIEKVELILSGPFCSKDEVVVTLTNGIQRCLDPEAKWVKQIINTILKRY